MFYLQRIKLRISKLSKGRSSNFLQKFSFHIFIKIMYQELNSSSEQSRKVNQLIIATQRFIREKNWPLNRPTQLAIPFELFLNIPNCHQSTMFLKVIAEDNYSLVFSLKVEEKSTKIEWESIMEKISKYNSFPSLLPFKIVSLEISKTIALKIYMSNIEPHISSDQILQALDSTFNIWRRFSDSIFIPKTNNSENQDKIAGDKESKIQTQRKKLKILRKVINQMIGEVQVSTNLKTTYEFPRKKYFGIRFSDDEEESERQVPMLLYERLKKEVLKEEKAKIQKNIGEKVGKKRFLKNILKRIEFVDLEQSDWKGEQTNNSKINKIYAKYLLRETQSLNLESNQLIESKEKIQLEGNLISKRYVPQEQRLFRTEIKILEHLRQSECEQIGNFFIEFKNQSVKENPQVLYSLFYKKQFKWNKFGTKHYMKIMTNLTEGLNFLFKRQLIHRDLKPENIMIDEEINPRIIDFGSAHPTYKNLSALKSLKLNQPLSTTKKYNMPYMMLPEMYKNLFTHITYDRHENFDMYAYGMIVEDIFKVNQQQKIDQFLLENLKWIHYNQVELDPKHRLNAEQLLIFMKELYRYYVILHKNL